MPCVCLFLYVTVTGTPQMFHRALQPHGCAPPQGWKHQPAHRFSEDLTPQRWAPAVPGTGIFLQRHLFSVTFSGEFLGLVENRFWQLLNKGYRRRKFQTLHMWKCFHLIMKLFFTSGLARDFPAGSHFFTSVLESVFLWWPVDKSEALLISDPSRDGFLLLGSFQHLWIRFNSDAS